VGHLTPYHRLEALGVRSIERMVIDQKSATYCRNMFRHLRTYFVLFVNMWDMMRIIAGLMNSQWKGHKMFMRCRVNDIIILVPRSTTREEHVKDILFGTTK
jgi:hypothetical protein